MQAYNSSSNGINSGNGPNSPAPYIKNEPQDESGRFLQQAPYHHDAYNGSIDPSELTMSPGLPIQQNGGFMQSYSNFPSSQNIGYVSSGAIDDEDLIALGNLDDRQLHGNGQFDMNHHSSAQNVNHDDYPTYQNLFPNIEGDQSRGHSGATGIPVSGSNIDVYSHTPDNAPAESPFVRNFTQQFRPLPSTYNGTAAEPASSYNSPIVGSDSTQGTNFDQYMATGKRKTRPGIDRTTSRKSPISRSPHTPKTPGLTGLSLGNNEATAVPSQPISTSHMSAHRHHKSLSSQWDGTPGSNLSYIDSPLSSPGQASAPHLQISEVFKSGKHASLPAKVENTIGSSGGQAFQTQEAKRRRRRESHNMVERRRRDNINERIQELSHLVPQHRLEDEKVRKHLVNNGSLSPTIGTGGSPPRATSMLAGGVGRRASGVPTSAGIASEEKDKGPNKGDILNGAVGWTRDLMWALYEKYEHEKELKALITQLGGTYPFEPTEDSNRMSSELYAAVEKNGVQSFRYSRAPGSNLRVPGYTDYAGHPLAGGPMISPPRTSPAHSTNGTNGQGTPQQQTQYWNQGGDGMTFKEEDEFNSMDMS
ncbi:hypothetical protein RUND412_000666 [Rhizina undulata]